MITRSTIIALVGLPAVALGDSALIRFDSLPQGTSLGEPQVVQDVRIEWRADPAATPPRWAQIPYNDPSFGVDNAVLAGETFAGSAVRFTPEGGGFITSFRYNIASMINQVPDLSYSVDLYGTSGNLLDTLNAGTDTFASLPNGLPIVSFGSDAYDFSTLELKEPVVAVDLRIELNGISGVRWSADNIGITWDPIPAPGAAVTLAMTGFFVTRRRREAHTN